MVKKIRDHSIVKTVTVTCIVLFCISFVLNGVNVFMFCRGLLLSELDEEAEARMTFLKEEMEGYRDIDWLIPYWVNNAEKMDYPKDENDEKTGKWHKNHSPYDVYQWDSLSSKAIEEAGDDAKKEKFAESAYVRLADEFIKYRRLTDEVSPMCFYYDEEGKSAVCLFDGTIHSEDGAPNPYGLGLRGPIQVKAGTHLSDLLSKNKEGFGRDFAKSNQYGKLIMYTMPVYGKDGKLLCVISESYYWAYYLFQLFKGCIGMELLNALFHVLILMAIICLLNAVMVRPNVSLQEAVQTYSEDKDTSQFVETLSPMAKYKNETGILAADVSDMALQLQRDMDTNLKLIDEKKRLEGQLSVAARLKSNLIPNSFPAFPEKTEFDIYADQVAIDTIGGDFYDFFTIDQDHIGVVIADIFEGGEASALFMMAFKLILEQVSAYGFSPSKTMEIVNNRLSNNNEMNLSAWFGVYECSTGIIHAVNAGHETPVIVSKDGAAEVKEDIRESAIGRGRGASYREYTFRLAPDERLLLYTDGVSQAENESHETFGIKRILETVKKAAAANPSEHSLIREISALQQVLLDFVGGGRYSDDVTLLCLRRVS